MLDAARTLAPEEVTLAAVSARLGVTSPALYRYFPDRASILETLAAEVREQVTSPAADLPWDLWLREAARKERDLWRSHTALYASAHYRAHSTPMVRMAIDGLKVLIHAGFSPADAFAGVTAATELAHALGHAESQRQPSSSLPPALTEELTSVLGDVLPVDMDELLTRSMDLVIDGLRVRLR